VSQPERATKWIVSGRVQGVGFRWFVLRRARALELVGWARNLADGRVEVVAIGPKESIAALDADLKTGPRLSRVDDVESSEYQHDMSCCKSFDIS
jgi:acylphosphatase